MSSVGASGAARHNSAFSLSFELTLPLSSLQAAYSLYDQCDAESLPPTSIHHSRSHPSRCDDNSPRALLARVLLPPLRPLHTHTTHLFTELDVNLCPANDKLSPPTPPRRRFSPLHNFVVVAPPALPPTSSTAAPSFPTPAAPATAPGGNASARLSSGAPQFAQQLSPSPRMGPPHPLTLRHRPSLLFGRVSSLEPLRFRVQR